MTTTTRHTPGPWTTAVYTVTETMLRRIPVGSHHHAVCSDINRKDDKGLLIALCGDEPGLDSTSARDARLIAAAPELLEILKRFVSVTAIGFDERDEAAEGEVWDAAQAAIAKAEGR